MATRTSLSIVTGAPPRPSDTIVPSGTGALAWKPGRLGELETVPAPVSMVPGAPIPTPRTSDGWASVSARAAVAAATIAAATSRAPLCGVARRNVPMISWSRAAAAWILVPPTSMPTVMSPIRPPRPPVRRPPTRSAGSIALRGPARIGLVAALAELVADHRALDLGGPLPDAVDAELAPDALDGLLAHVAASAEDLHGLVGHPARGLRAHELDRARERVELLARGPAAGGLPPHAVEHRLRGHDLGGHVGQHELDRLELDYRPAELLALLRERERQVERARGCAHRPRADHDALLDEPVLRELEPLTGLAEDRALVHPPAAAPPRGRLHHRGIRARALLGDRVGVAALAAASRPQVAVLLRLGPDAQRDRRPPGDVPQRAGSVPPLLLH